MTPTPPLRSLVVYGHVGFDVNSKAGRVTRTIGGAAYYASMAAAAQGAVVDLVTVLGSDFPKAELALGRLRLAAVPTVDRPSAVFAQTYDEAGEVVAFEGRLNACELLTPNSIPLASSNPGVVLITTMPTDYQAEAIGRLHADGFDGIVAIDTALSYVGDFGVLLRREGQRIGVTFVNAVEYEALAAPPPSAITVVKRGSQGASLLQNGRWIHVPGHAADPVVTVTGAGDVLAGAFLAMLLSGIPTIQALEQAVAYATGYVQHGARYFHRTYTQSPSDQRGTPGTVA